MHDSTTTATQGTVGQLEQRLKSRGRERERQEREREGGRGGRERERQEGGRDREGGRREMKTVLWLIGCVIAEVLPPSEVGRGTLPIC